MKPRIHHLRLFPLDVGLSDRGSLASGQSADITIVITQTRPLRPGEAIGKMRAAAL
jgi:hypothetical protein